MWSTFQPRRRKYYPAFYFEDCGREKPKNMFEKEKRQKQKTRTCCCQQAGEDSSRVNANGVPSGRRMTAFSVFLPLDGPVGRRECDGSTPEIDWEAAELRHVSCETNNCIDCFFAARSFWKGESPQVGAYGMRNGTRERYIRIIPLQVLPRGNFKGALHFGEWSWYLLMCRVFFSPCDNRSKGCCDWLVQVVSTMPCYVVFYWPGFYFHTVMDTKAVLPFKFNKTNIRGKLIVGIKKRS